MASQEVSEHVEHVDDPHLTVRRTLPLVGERTWWHVQGQVAVQLTLPLGGERAGRHAVHCHSSVNVRGGTFRVEWQCRPHCDSASSVPHRYDQGRVAVRPVRSEASGSATHTATRHLAYWAARRTLPLGIERTASVRSGASGSASGTFGGEWQCDSHCHSVVSVPGSAPYTATRHRAYRIGTIRTEWQCWPGRTPDPQPSRRLESGPTGQMRSGNRPPSRRGGLRRGPQASAWG